MKTLLWIIPLALVITFSASCVKKGCTDQNAVNYDSDANDDDGTCCIKSQSDSSITHAVYDNDPNSSLFGELIAAIVVKQITFSFSGSTCADLGYGSDRCEDRVILTSNRPENVSFPYTVEFGPGLAWVVSETANLGTFEHQEILVNESCEAYDLSASTFDVGAISYN